MAQTSNGLDENIAGALAYGLGWVTGVVFLLIEPSNAFVRFHAWQSVIVFGALSVIWFIAVSIPLLGWAFAFLVLPPVSAALWLWLMFKAYQGEHYKLPYAGDMAEQQR